MEAIRNTVGGVQCEQIGAIFPHLYADADFAGCVETQRSTSGAHLVLKGPVLAFR